MTRPARNQRGVALLLALLLTAVVTVLAVAVAGDQAFALHRSHNLSRRMQAGAYLTGVEYLAAAHLRSRLADAQAPSPVRLRLPWPLEVAGRGTLRDAQGCFNLNALSPQAGDITLAEARFRRLLALLDLPAAIADQLLDWLDEDAEARFAGAEDDAYSRRDPPLRAADAPLADVSELRLLPAVDAEAYAALAPLVCALAPDAAINVNAAPPLVLAAVIDGLGPGRAGDLAARAAAAPFASLDAFLADPALSGLLVEAAGLTVRSDWFALQAEVTLDGLTLQRDSLLQMQKGQVRVRRRLEHRVG
ncbi:MAG: type II secretion system minor pseudopilin GspK [Immundisolibacter sp.]